MAKRFIEFAPSPGVVKDLTANAATGSWIDSQHVRFRKGFPEKIGGWVKQTASAFLGICRAMHQWVTLNDYVLIGLGTHLKYYILTGDSLADVTPIRDTNALGANPIATTSGSAIVTITDTGHGAAVGDYVTISGATAFNNLTTGNLNQEFAVLTVPTANTYTVNVGANANASSSGGGAGVSAAYQLSVGSESVVLGSGWGSGAWGRSTWSSPADVSTPTNSLRLWSQDNWGEDLLFAPRYGEIYKYDASSPARAVAISSEGGASDVPVVVTEILVCPKERIVMALGCNELGASTLDGLMVRWTDYEDYLNWTPDTDVAAGGFRLSSGSRIVTGLYTNREILVWTDRSLYGLQFVGGVDEVFQVALLDASTSIIGPNTKTQIGGSVYWMGAHGFYCYDGRVSRIPCSVEDDVFRNLNTTQRWKVTCGSNSGFTEVWWFIPSEDENELDRYVIYNIEEGSWYIGSSFARSAWIDRSFDEYPRAAGLDGHIYVHENGVDDGSTVPASAIVSYVESAPLEIGGDGDMGRGDRFAFVDRLIPDVTFRDSIGTPTLTYTFKQRAYPGLAYEPDEDASVIKGTTVTQHTPYKSIRLRARAIALKVYNDEAGADWRLGVQRFQVRTDGRKE